MEYSRIKKSVFEQIEIVAREFGKLKKGCNNQRIEEENQKIILYNKYSLPAKKEMPFNKKVSFLVWDRINLGSSIKYAIWVRILTLQTATFKTATNCYFVDNNGIKYKKDKIQYIVEES